MEDQIYVQLINLDDDRERLRRSTECMLPLGIKFDRLSAENGGEVADAGVTSIRVLGRKLYSGEIGCYKSHLRAIDRFLQSNASYGLVLEDDAVPLNDTVQRLRDLVEVLAKMPTWDAVNLSRPVKQIMTPVGDIFCDQRLGLCYAHYPPVTTTAILWSRGGAREFRLMHSNPVVPVDVAIQSWGASTDRVLALNCPLFVARDGKSTIGPKYRKSGGAGVKGLCASFKRIGGAKLSAMRNRSVRRMT